MNLLSCLFFFLFLFNFDFFCTINVFVVVLAIHVCMYVCVLHLSGRCHLLKLMKFILYFLLNLFISWKWIRMHFCFIYNLLYVNPVPFFIAFTFFGYFCNINYMLVSCNSTGESLRSVSLYLSGNNKKKWREEKRARNVEANKWVTLTR